MVFSIKLATGCRCVFEKLVAGTMSTFYNVLQCLQAPSCLATQGRPECACVIEQLLELEKRQLLRVTHVLLSCHLASN